MKRGKRVPKARTENGPMIRRAFNKYFKKYGRLTESARRQIIERNRA